MKNFMIIWLSGEALVMVSKHCFKILIDIANSLNSLNWNLRSPTVYLNLLASVF